MKNEQTTGRLSFRNVNLSVKIAAIMVLMIVVLITLIIVISNYNIRKSMTNQIGREFEITTSGINEALTEYLLIYVNQITTLSLNEGLQRTIIKQNNAYSSNLQDNLSQIKTTDKAWIDSKGNIPLANKIITDDYDVNKASEEIFHFLRAFDEHKEILLTDKYGALVAASGITSDYYQGDEAWWTSAWNGGNGGFFISRPSYDESLNDVVIMLAFPVYSNDNEPIGVIRTNLIASNTLQFLENANSGKTGGSFLTDKTGSPLIRNSEGRILENLSFVEKNNESHLGYGITLDNNGKEVIYGFAKFDVSFVKNIMGLMKGSFVEAVHDLDWYIIYKQETSEAFSSIKVANQSILITGLILLGIFIVLVLLVIKRMLLPLQQIVEKGYQVIDGDFSVNIQSRSNDEVGKLSSMFNDLVHSLREMALTAKNIANGDLSGKVEPRSDKDEMGKAFAQMTESLRTQINNINEVVAVLTSSNSQLMSTVAQVSSSSNETATTVSEITTTIEEVRQTAEVSSQKARNVAESANKSVQISENGIKSTEASIEGMNHIQNQVKQIAETIIKLSDQSQIISEITGSVKDLAEQSNLLAVNASIEAVKAGEYGKGFGVVAQEIRALANQSKQATKQINEILSDVQKAISSAVMATEQGGKAVDKGVLLAEASGDAISMLADSIAEAAQASSQIAASSHQQLSGMEQLTVAMDNIRQATQQNATGNKETEKAVGNLKIIVQNLKELTGKYKVS